MNFTRKTFRFFISKHQLLLPVAFLSSYYASTRLMRAQALQYPSTKDRIRGEYENKIRRDSPPEKIFETFATVNENGRLYMTHYDLFKAICPYNYAVRSADTQADSSATATTKTFTSKALINFVDIDGDGKISLYEYFLIVCLIQVAREDIKKWFLETAKIQNELIDMPTIRKFYDFMREKSRVKLTITHLPDPRRIALNKREFDEAVQNLVDKMFQKYPDKKIPLKDFLRMREDFLEDIYRYEFENYALDAQKTISGEDFAKSIICFFDVNEVQKYMKMLKDVDFPGRVSFQDYYVFHKFLQDNMQRLHQMIEEKGAITRNRLSKLIQEYQQKLGVKANLDMIDIFIRVLDVDNSKKIECDEFIGIVQQRQFYGAGEDRSLKKPFIGVKEEALLWINKAERIWQIIRE